MSALPWPREIDDPPPPHDAGVSPSAERLRQLRNARDWGVSLVMAERFSALRRACNLAAIKNWDGYGGEAVSPVVYRSARAFLEFLPFSVPDPDVGADPDGEISFEWHLSPRRVFSVSVGERGQLSYAGLFGASKTYGTEHFVNELPRAITDNLTRLLASP
jgi:hypothetical protein